MRILFVTQIVPYPPHGGVLQRGFNLLRELGRTHAVHLLAFHHRDELQPGEPVERSKRELGMFCHPVEYFDLWPKRSMFHLAAGLVAAGISRQPFSVLAHRSDRLASRVAHLCHSDGSPDLVHLDTIALAPYLRFCGDVPVVLAHHNIESQLMARRAGYEKGWPQRCYLEREARKLRRLEANFVGRVETNITVSEADANTLGKICPGVSTAVVSNGVDAEYFTSRRVQEEPCLIFTGGMNMFANRDGVDWFLDEVWQTVKTSVPDVRFVAIGQRPSKRLLAAVASDSKVEAPGFVEDIRPAVARAAVYIVPLRVGGGTRLKVLDAMAQGKAIVSTSLGAEGIDIRDGEHLLIADDAQAFAHCVVDLLQRPEQRARLGAAARLRAEEQYSWPMLGQSLARAYEDVVAQRRP